MLNKSSTTLRSEAQLPKMNYKALAMGISTGGPISLQKIVPFFSEKIKIPIFIVQHMPPKFTASLADRLNSLSALEVKEATDNELVRNGVVYIAPGGLHMTLKKDNLNNTKIVISEKPDDVLHRPSVDVMLELGAKYIWEIYLGCNYDRHGKGWT